MKTMLEAYTECALWSSMDFEGNPLDNDYNEADIAPETLAGMKSDCEDFRQSIGKDLEIYLESHSMEQLGHDFWLTRNGHGAGFWDRGLGDLGDRLNDAAKVYGSFDLIVGDDGKIYS